MSAVPAAVAVAGASVGAVVALTVARARIRKPSPKLVRTNYRGKQVPAVLGDAVVLGGLVAVGAAALAAAAGIDAAPGRRMTGATVVLLLVLGGAGAWDDWRGDERPRGFRGHLEALGARRVTGGLVKLLAGGIAGLVAGAILTDADPVGTIQIGLIVALTANLINLLDRAPGRAAKGALLVWWPLALLGSPAWSIAAAGTIGALLAVMGHDLKEEGMLGDAGANPIGALLGLGLAVALFEPGRWIAVLVLTLLNAASERWSFSTIIDGNPVLHAVDRLGRLPDTDEVARKPAG